MKTPLKKRLPSPARSQGAGPRTPIRHRHRRTLSVGSARSNASGRLTALIQQNRNMDSFAVSPLASRKSILSDNTEIEEPRRKSWWKKLGENSRDVTELLEENKNAEPNNIIEELDIEVLSQEKRNYTMDLPESSDSESINSIVIPQRKLFTQKENLPQKKFGEIIGTRETLAKLHKTSNTNVEKSINVVTRELFQNNQRSKPIFPAALLNISPNKTTADRTKELATVEPKAQVRNIFGNRATKRKNIFTNFIVSESEDEIPEIQPKVFDFQKKIEAKRRGSSSSRGIREPSPTSSITTDIEMDDWKMLPSSTMVEHQLEVMMADGNSPKRTRLSKLTEIEFEGSSNTTKQSNKSVQSKEKSRKSKTFTKEKEPECNAAEEIFGQDEESSDKPRKSKTFTKEKASENSMTTRNKSDGNVEQFQQDHDEQSKSLKDKSRKSKTFTKDKLPEAESMSARNKSIASQNVDEETETQKDGDKSRKSKTFTKEKGTNLETSMNTKNKSMVSQNNEEAAKNKSKISLTEEVVQSQETVNKSKSKFTELNMSQASIKTRSQSKANSPNTSQIISGEIVTENVESSDKTKSKSPKNTETQTPSEATVQDNDDDALNFTLEYENEDQQNEEIPETIPNKSNIQTRTSKSITLQENSANVSKTNKTMLNKVIDESAEIESTQENSDQLLKGKNISQNTDGSHIEGEIKSNDEQTEHHDDSENDELQKSIKNQSEDMEDKNLTEISQQEENEDSQIANNDNSEKQHESLVENNEIEDQNESEVENNDESEVKNDIEAEKSQEEEESNEINEIEEDVEIASENEDETDDVSQEIEDDDNNGSQENEEQNESQDEIQNESDVQNESQEENQNDSEDEHIEIEEEQNDNEIQNESEVMDENEEEDEEQNISQELDNEEQNESEVVNSESDSDSDGGNNSQDVNNSINNDEIENDPEVVENEDEIETPNVSHDTTGRNRKKNESPEVILHDSNDHLESFAIRGRNTSVRKTEMIKTMNIRPSLAPVRESTGFSDGTRNSSADGSGWDSHRTTRKTLRQTFGKDFTPRKSLRALVMEKSAKRQTQHNDLASVTTKFPQANSTELPEMSNRFDDDQENQEPIHEVSLRTRQTTLERYLQEIKKKNTETRLKMEEEVLNSLNAPSKEHIFKVPAKPFFARRQTKPPAKPKQTKSTLFLGELPAEVIEDLKYKPPKRFQPSNAPWITKRLYKFLESKLEAKYDYKARVRAEKLVEHIYNFAKDLRRHDVATSDAVDVLKREMARLDVVKTHFEFYEFFRQFMPREVRVKVIPDVVNKISLPRHGVFSDIL